MVRLEARLSKERLEVNEAQYVRTNEGPSDDTGAFYVGTPRPGQRQVDDREAPPAGRANAETPIWIRRVGRPQRAQGASIEITPGNRAALAVVVVGGALTALSMLILVVWMFWPSSPDPTTNGTQVEPKAEERYQGLKVKKGLQ